MRRCANSIDAVSDRDFVLEFLAAAAIAATHLSRLAEELVLWSTPQFGFIRMPEEFSSGSSIMPQKRNPDAAELVRGKTRAGDRRPDGAAGRAEGLPLAYSKDLQEDKEPVFDAADTLELCLAATAAMIGAMTVDRERLAAAAAVGHTTATDLADWLVRRLGVTFREAHQRRQPGGAPGRGARRRLWPLSISRICRAIEPRITGEVLEVLSVECSVASRTSFGGTAPARVREAIQAAQGALPVSRSRALVLLAALLVLGGCSLGCAHASRRCLAAGRTWVGLGRQSCRAGAPLNRGNSQRGVERLPVVCYC